MKQATIYITFLGYLLIAFVGYVVLSNPYYSFETFVGRLRMSETIYFLYALSLVMIVLGTILSYRQPVDQANKSRRREQGLYVKDRLHHVKEKYSFVGFIFILIAIGTAIFYRNELVYVELIGMIFISLFIFFYLLHYDREVDDSEELYDDSNSGRKFFQAIGMVFSDYRKRPFGIFFICYLMIVTYYLYVGPGVLLEHYKILEVRTNIHLLNILYLFKLTGPLILCSVMIFFMERFSMFRLEPVRVSPEKIKIIHLIEIAILALYLSFWLFHLIITLLQYLLQ